MVKKGSPAFRLLNRKQASTRMSIKFGTSGWRAIIGKDFTFANVENVTNSICRYLKTNNANVDQPLIIGHDSRFMGEKFAEFAGEIAASQGFKVLLCMGPTPTPTISFAIREQKALGALNFTASHNPPEYQGIKFSTSDGAPALPEVTTAIETLIVEGGGPSVAETGSVDEFDPKAAYFDDLRGKINLEAIANGKPAVAFDALWGTGRGYLDTILREHGVSVETIHDWRDVLFGGRSPEPAADHLEELRQAVTSNRLTLGLATDGDADRFGIMDSDGTYIEPNKIVALLADYLIESRGWTQGVARSVATSHLVDRVAKDRGIELFETPVGFKFIGELINEDKIVLGGEESAGLSIKGHYPEKDGILACLLALEAVVVRGASLGEQLEELYGRVGKLESGRIGVRLTDEVAAKLKEKLERSPAEIAGRKVREINRLDGVKFLFGSDAWMLMRPSGTEPMVRIYAEAETKPEVEELLRSGREYLLS